MDNWKCANTITGRIVDSTRSLNVIKNLTLNFYENFQNNLHGISLNMKNIMKLISKTIPNETRTGMIFL
jgi:hypothetical protein